MERPNFLTKTFVYNLGRYVVYFLPFLISPFIAKPLSVLFDFVGYGQWIGFFYETAIVLLWLFCIGGIALADGLVARRKRKIAQQTAVEQTEMPEVSKLPIKNKSEKLPLVNVLILWSIAILCVLAISLQIGFQVKPFFDIGERNAAPQIWAKVMVIVKNVVKCVWIMYFLNAALKISAEIFKDVTDEKAKECLTWMTAGFFLMVFGIYDVVTACQDFTITYIIFYALFPLIHCLTKKSNVKSYLIILFIYLF